MPDLAARSEGAGAQAVDGRRLAFGAVAMGAVSLLKAGVQLLMLPVMARLLGPAEYGVYALALPTITLLMLLADGGLGNSLAREKPSDLAVWSSAFWATLVVGVVLALGAIALSFGVAAVTREPRLPLLTAALSFSFILLALSILPGARLLRAGRLDISAGTDLVATLGGAALAIALAMRGAGAWSLAAQFLGAYALRAAIMNLASPQRLTLQLRWRLLRPHLRMGGSIVGTRLVDHIGRLSENAVLGRFLGAPTLGAYSLSNQISRFLTQAALNPTWASLYVKSLHEDGNHAAASYIRLARLLSLLVFPMAALAAPGAAHSVGWLLGPDWSRAGALLLFMLPSQAFAAVGALSGAMLYARGRSDVQLWLSSGLSIGRVAAVATAILFGLEVALWGYAAANFAYFLAGVLAAPRLLGVPIARLARAVAGPLLSSLGVGLGVHLAIRSYAPDLTGLVLFELAGVAAYAVLLALLDGRHLRDDLTVAAVMLRRRKLA